jgi:uncharacterized metal-binding protein
MSKKSKESENQEFAAVIAVITFFAFIIQVIFVMLKLFGPEPKTGEHPVHWAWIMAPTWLFVTLFAGAILAAYVHSFIEWVFSEDDEVKPDPFKEL